MQGPQTRGPVARPAHQAQVGVAGRGDFAQGQPQPEPGLVVVREGVHGRHAVGTPGQGHQQRGQEHAQGVAHPAPVAWIGQGLQTGDEGAQGGQECGVGTSELRGRGGCRGDCTVSITPAGCTAALFVDAFGGPVPAVVTGCQYRITPPSYPAGLFCAKQSRSQPGTGPSPLRFTRPARLCVCPAG